MLQSNQKIIRHKVGLLNLAEELGNVSKACQMMGLSTQAAGRERHRSACIVQLICPPSSKRDKCKHRARTRDDNNREPCVRRYCGSWGAELYNNERTHQGKVCEGRTPMQTLEDGKEIWKEKFLDQT